MRAIVLSALAMLLLACTPVAGAEGEPDAVAGDEPDVLEAQSAGRWRRRARRGGDARRSRIS